MAHEYKAYLTAEGRDRIIRNVIDNPYMSKKEIDKEAGIPYAGNRPLKYREEVILKPWIQENTHFVFGEDIDWQSRSFTNMRGTPKTPDLVGKDAEDQTIIVEVKFKFEFLGDKNHIRSDPEHDAIGQILHDASAYMRPFLSDNLLGQMPRLFIVSIDFSPNVNAVCELLKAFNINSKHIAIEKIFPK